MFMKISELDLKKGRPTKYFNFINKECQLTNYNRNTKYIYIYIYIYIYKAGYQASKYKTIN